MMKNDNTTPADPDARGQTPGREAFATAEEAWLWAMTVRQQRQTMRKMQQTPAMRGC